MKNRLIAIVIAAFFIIAFIPALDQPADVSLGKANSGCDACDQLVALTSAYHDIDEQRLWLRASAFIEIPYLLPIALPAAADPRAPPA
jgi:hypothetical protein